jgi:arylsulfatase A-like enzyme
MSRLQQLLESASMRSPSEIGLSIEGSTPGNYSLPHPAPGAPNVVLIVLDDLGFGQLGCFGSGISTPAIDRLAAGGLRYNHFHVTSLCSPTRACLMTGRNHHAVGMGFLTDLPMAFPGYTGRLPKSAIPLPRLLRDGGYNTTAIGKWHLVPGGERSEAGPFDRWPLGFGFERYYGFLQGDTNHWAPHLVEDNHYVEQPVGPRGGYHLTEDLADRAIRSVTAQHQAAPDRPFFLYFALGATHAPHHVTPEWVEPYVGAFDGGWERWRDEVFARQVESGVVPAGTELGPRPSWIDEWSSLAADARRMLARQQEVFAGFLSHTDAQIGRVLDQLERLGVLDDTLVMLISDNGASGEGGALGTFNEHRFTEHVPDTVAGNIAWSDELGGLRTYPHYSWGWAWAGNTPLRLWKRYTWLGGTRTPLIAHWPRGIDTPGEVRDQFVHAIDLMPTVLDVAGVEPPDMVDGVTQQPFDGASIRTTFTDATAPAPRSVQYFEMLGSRSIVADGWKATTDHVSKGVVDEERLLEGSRTFTDDRWALFKLQDDFAETHDLAGERPDVVRALQERWTIEAGRNHVFPLVDELIGRIAAVMPWPNPVAARTVYRPEGGPVPDDSVARLFGGFRLVADVDVPNRGAAGILGAMGDWTGGFAFFVRDGCLVFVLNRAGDEGRVESDAPVPAGRHELACVLTPGLAGPAVGLYHDDELVAHAVLPVTAPMVFQHGGTMLMLGRDRGLPVCSDYEPPFPWTGVLHELVVETGPEIPRSALDETRALLHHE